MNSVFLVTNTLLYTSRVVILSFDAMAIDQQLHLNINSDEVDGFIDLGPQLGRRAAIASNVLVFMVKSVTTKWKQTIGHFFIGPSLHWSSLQQLVMNALHLCHDVGLTVLAVVCDQESSQCRLWKELHVTPQVPGFQHPVTKQMVFVVPDPVHLLKGIRNNLMNHRVVVSDQ